MDKCFIIRAAVSSDAAQLSDLGMRTYMDSHGPFLPSKEELENYVKQAHAIDTIKAELADPTQQYFVAQDMLGKLVGYIKLRPCALMFPQKLPDDPEIQRLYIDEHAQGKGIGRALMQRVFEHLRNRGMRTVYLGVYEGNTKAIHFYESFGAVQCSEHIFYVGNTGCVNPIYRIAF